MTKKRANRLGRGLDSLLGDDVSLLDDLAQPPSSDKGTQTVNLSLIERGKYQPRLSMDEDGLDELAESIKEQGVMQPILVRVKTSRNKVKKYEIIAGERRFRAAQLAGLKEVPVIIREVDDQQAAVMALIENIQREDLNPLEEAKGIQRLLNEFGLTHEAAAQAIGRSRSATSNLLRLLNLAAPVQELVAQRALDMGHARALLALDAAEQLMVAQKVVQEGLSVRETERLVEREKEKDTAKPKPKAHKDGDVLRFERKLSDFLGTTVQLKLSGKSKGQLRISFQDWEHLQFLLEKQGLAQVIEEEVNTK